MKRKTHIRMILIFAITIAGILLLSSTEVQANENCYNSISYLVMERGQVPEDFVTEISANYTINEKWINYEKSYEHIINEIAELLEQKNITYTKMSFNQYMEEEQKNGTDWYKDIDTINVWSYGASDIYIDFHCEHCTQQITATITYSNSSEYNETDKQYVENILNSLPWASQIANNAVIEYYDILTGKSIESIEKILQRELKDTGIIVKEGEGGSGSPPDNYFGGGRWQNCI